MTLTKPTLAWTTLVSTSRHSSPHPSATSSRRNDELCLIHWEEVTGSGTGSTLWPDDVQGWAKWIPAVITTLGYIQPQLHSTPELLLSLARQVVDNCPGLFSTILLLFSLFLAMGKVVVLSKTHLHTNEGPCYEQQITSWLNKSKYTHTL